jgi:hypothetical protein
MPEMEHYERALDWLDRHGLLDASAQGLRPELGLAGTCAWILLREHLSTVRAISGDEYAPLGHALSALQDPSTGLFGESRDGPPPGAASVEMLGTPSTRALTGIALQALRALRQRPAHALRVLEGLERVGGAAPWLETLDWTNPVLAAEDVASMALCLVHEAEVDGRRDACRAYHELLDRIEALQDSRSGLFGVSKDSFPWRSIVASDFLIPLYAYVRRPLVRVSTVIDTILSLEETDDGLARTRGTAREALAAVRMLMLLGRQSSYRRSDVSALLVRTLAAIINMQQADGSFADAHPSAPDHLFSVPMAAGSQSSVSELYPTWLRVLTITALRGICDGHETSRLWPSHDWPGLGYQQSGVPLTEHERTSLPGWIRATAYADIPPVEPSESPRLTVVVPCYNLGLYLHEAIESVLAQTSHDFEIIIVDDGSTDEYTGLVLEHLQRPRTRVVRQVNCGLAAARNAGIRQSTGRYICCLDPDDRLRPEFFARACAILDRDQEIGVVSGHFELFDEREDAYRYERCAFPDLLVRNSAIEPAIFRRGAWQKAGGYCLTFSASGVEDWDLWISTVELGYRVDVIQETVWEYRVRSDQMSTSMYRPDIWGPLNRELAGRHPDSYREHVEAVVARHAESWAELRMWANECEAAVAWWERCARTWERLAVQRQEEVQEREARIAALERRIRDERSEEGV